MDLLVNPVDVIRHDIVHIHRARLAISQTAAHHHDDFERKDVIRDGQHRFHIVERRE
ncbi:hypothetical protein ACH4UM_12875 [Streptomyces sp. NPDC020801]|uniref:hypothetical protein n=1 Tax=unclassified Streptomyces TaxID=2593676 RepID=UPI0037937900